MESNDALRERLPPRTARDSAILIATLLALYVASPLRWLGNDTRPAPLAAVSLVKRGDLYLDAFRPRIFAGRTTPPYYVVTTRDGRLVSRFGIGASLTAFPFFAVDMFAHGGRISEQHAGAVARFAASTLVALAAGMLFAAARSLGATRQTALCVALTYGLGTSAWSIASQALWQHGPAQFWLALAMLLLARGASPFGVGGALGMMVLCRPPDFFLALAVGAWAIRAWRRAPGRVASFVAGAAIPAITLGTLNALWFGAPWRVAQSIRVVGSDAAELPGGSYWGTNPLVGLAGLLFSPSRGLVVYSPVLLLAFTQRSWGASPRPPWLLALGVGAAMLVAMVSCYYGWYGGWNFGPRMVADLAPVLALATLPAWSSRGRRPYTAIPWLLLTVSVLIHAAGAFNYNPMDWDGHPNIDLHVGRLWSLRDAQLVHVFTRRATMITW